MEAALQNSAKLICAPCRHQLFSNDTRLADAVRDPPESGSPLESSPFKTKEYELCMLSSRTHEVEDFVDLAALEESLSQPFTFQKV